MFEKDNKQNGDAIGQLLAAGYSVRTAEVQASILLRYPKVSAAVAELQGTGRQA